MHNFPKRRINIMTRVELAAKVGVDDKALKAVFDAIKDEVVAGNKVDIAGFGSFQPADRAARTARNPQTGEVIQVAAKKAVKFKVSKTFKDALN
jgi:DNA-binding protein HU-beta